MTAEVTDGAGGPTCLQKGVPEAVEQSSNSEVEEREHRLSSLK